MTRIPAHVRRELQALRAAFLAQLPERTQAIEAALHGVTSGGEVDRERVDAVFHLAHRLSGSAGIYGYPTVYAAAGAVEQVAEGLRDAAGPNAAEGLAELRQRVEALKRATEVASKSAPSQGTRTAS